MVAVVASSATVPLCRIQTLSSLEGIFGGSGGSNSVCSWHINPGLVMQSIEFWLEGAAQFEGADALSIYGQHWPQDALPRAIDMQTSSRVASFHSSNPLPERMALTGLDQLSFVLRALDNNTRFRLRYECKPYGTKLGSTWLSPVGWACVLAAFVVASLSVIMMPVYLVCYYRARRKQELALQESQVLVRGEMAHRKREVELARAQEQVVVQTLQALPVTTWRNSGADQEQADPVIADDATDECCLCLETFVDEDTLRVLPCKHYFHQACIDNWFAARRFLPRTCPVCKRNPVAEKQPAVPNAMQPPMEVPVVEDGDLLGQTQGAARIEVSEGAAQAIPSADDTEIVELGADFRTEALTEADIIGRPQEACVASST